jgi:dTMP kinase
MKGQLIVFEGGEGAGKTTQIKRLIPWLKSRLGEEIPILFTREPGGTLLGSQIRELLLNTHKEEIENLTELLLYAADRAQHVEEYLKPHLQKGAIILCDRYCDSTIAYQGYGRGFDLNLIQQLNQIATGGLESDLTFWLDVDIEKGLQRVKRRGECDRLEKAELGFHQRIRQGFEAIAKANPHRIIPIDGNQSEDEVYQQIKSILIERLYTAKFRSQKSE